MFSGKSRSHQAENVGQTWGVGTRRELRKSSRRSRSANVVFKVDVNTRLCL